MNTNETQLMHRIETALSPPEAQATEAMQDCVEKLRLTTEIGRIALKFVPTAKRRKREAQLEAVDAVADWFEEQIADFAAMKMEVAQ